MINVSHHAIKYKGMHGCTLHSTQPGMRPTTASWALGGVPQRIEPLGVGAPHVAIQLGEANVISNQHIIMTHAPCMRAANHHDEHAANVQINVLQICCVRG